MSVPKRASIVMLEGVNKMKALTRMMTLGDDKDSKGGGDKSGPGSPIGSPGSSKAEAFPCDEHRNAALSDLEMESVAHAPPEAQFAALANLMMTGLPSPEEPSETEVEEGDIAHLVMGVEDVGTVPPVRTQTIGTDSTLRIELALPATADGETFHKVGAANDIIVVRRADGGYSYGDWQVQFDKKVRIGSGHRLVTANAVAHIFLNGQLLPHLYMRVSDDGTLVFPDGTIQPPTLEGVNTLENLLPGVNTVRFEIRFRGEMRVLVAECFAFRWDVGDRLLVVDIDGTITKSDVPGLLMTFSPGSLDHTQPGICSLLHHISAEGAHILYLTSRPMVLAPRTRAFLMGLRQDGLLLPLGPLLTCQSKLTDVVYREIIAKDMHEYKGEALLNVARIFYSAGRSQEDSVFAAGIGNRETDALAYQNAGVPPDFICIIDPSANIQIWSSTSGLRKMQNGGPDFGDRAGWYDTYNDSRFFELLRASLDPVKWQQKKERQRKDAEDAKLLALEAAAKAEMEERAALDLAAELSAQAEAAQAEAEIAAAIAEGARLEKEAALREAANEAAIQAEREAELEMQKAAEEAALELAAAIQTTAALERTEALEAVVRSKVALLGEMSDSPGGGHIRQDINHMGISSPVLSVSGLPAPPSPLNLVTSPITRAYSTFGDDAIEESREDRLNSDHGRRGSTMPFGPETPV